MSTAISDQPSGFDDHELIPRPEERSTRRRFALWFGVAGPIAAWTGHAGISWGLMENACLDHNLAWNHVTTIVFTIVAGLAFITAMRVFHDVQIERNRHQDTPMNLADTPLHNAGAGDTEASTGRSPKAVQTDFFMSLLGMLTSGFLFVVIIVEDVPAIVLTQCGPTQ